MSERLRAAAPPALLALASAAVALGGKPARPSAAPAAPAALAAPGRPCSPEALALLGGLRSGDTVASLRVDAISCSDREIQVSMSGASGSTTAIIVPSGSRPHKAPEATRRCDIFYQAGRPPPGREEQGAALSALAARVREAEGKGLPPGW